METTNSTGPFSAPFWAFIILWLTSPSQMPGRVHAFVQNAHDIDGAVHGAIKNPVMPDRQDLEGWFHRGTAGGRIVQNNVQRVIDAGAVFCQLSFPPSGERVGENIPKIAFGLLRQFETAFRG